MKTILFNGDNTLLNFNYGYLAAYHMMSQQVNLPHSPTYFTSFDNARIDAFNAYVNDSESNKPFLITMMEIYLERIHINRKPELLSKIFLDKLLKNNLLCSSTLDTVASLSKQSLLYAFHHSFIDTTYVNSETLDLPGVTVLTPDPCISNSHFISHITAKIPDFQPCDALFVSAVLNDDFFQAKEIGLKTCYLDLNNSNTQHDFTDIIINDLSELTTL